MKRLFYCTLAILFSITVLRCKKETDPNPSGGATGPDNSVATAPVVNSAAPTISGVAATSATVSAVIAGNGGTAIKQYGFVYSKTNPTPTTADNKTEAGATTGPFPLTFTSSLSSLEAGSTYHIRAYATNDKGISYGTIAQVTTNSSSNPTADKVVWKAAQSLSNGFDYTQLDALKAGADGSVLVAGTYDKPGKMGQFTLTPLNLQDGFLAKLDSKGEPLWVLELKSTSSDAVYSIDLDARGNYYVGLRAGTRGGSFGGVSLPGSGSNVAKVSPNGTVEWVRTLVAKSSQIEVDAQGNLYTLGRLVGPESITVGTATLTGTDGSEGWDTFLAKFDPNGVFQWVRQFTGPGTQDLYYDVDPNGSVYASLQSPKGVPSIGVTKLASAGQYLLKISPTGTTEWSKTLQNSANSSITDLQCKISGEFIVSISSQIGTTVEGIISTAAEPSILAVFRENGTLKWGTALKEIYYKGYEIDKEGNLYMVGPGRSYSPEKLGDIDLPALFSSQAYDNAKTIYLLLGKYSPVQKKWQWALRSQPVAGNPSSARVAVTTTGSVLLASSFPTGKTQFGTTVVEMTSRFGIIVAAADQP